MSILEASIARLARETPSFIKVFNDYSLSLCCDENITLRQAIVLAKLDQDEVMAALSKLDPEVQDMKDWNTADDQEIINYLLARFHQVHRVQLQELQHLAERVETVHQQDVQCPLGLAEHLKHMQLELEQHMQKEEQILFPMIENGQGKMVGGPIHVMKTEHDEHVHAIHQIDQLTNNMKLPEDACNTWQTLYLGLTTFKEDLQQHIHLENNILFARYSDPLEDYHASVL